MRIHEFHHTVSEQKLQQAQAGLAQLLGRKDLGFFALPDRPQNWSSSQGLGLELTKHFDDLVIVGIGGSSLGPRVIGEVVTQANSKKRLHFCDNVDELEFARLTAGLRDPKRTAFLIISKSGSTIETLVGTDFLHQHYAKLGLNFTDYVYVVSELRNNPLVSWANMNSRPVLEIPLDVGGRFSVLTPVGLVPAAFLGASVEDIRLGALEALADRELVSQIIAQSLESFSRKEDITLFWFYSSWLKNFGGWLVQLWAESLGKRLDRKGKPAAVASTPMSAIGSCDQHSILQQVMEGARDKFVIFTRVRDCETGTEKLKKSQFSNLQFFNGKKMGDLLAAEAQATVRALGQEGVSTMTLQLEDLSPKSLGYLFMFWELVVGGLGECLDINAFDQPGVELGKSLAKEILIK